MLCFVGQGDDVRPARQLADQDAALVADRLGVDVFVAGVPRATPLTCMPPLWAKALLPTNGWSARKFMLTIS